MIPVTHRARQKIAVFGLGGSGLSTAHALVEGGADVIAFDDNPKRVSDARDAGLATANLRGMAWDSLDALVLSPGVPLTHPKPHWTVALASEAGVPIIGDVELFFRELAHRDAHSTLVAITGTNGKSTTTALIAHLLSHAGRDVAVGGNIGTPVLELDEPADGRIFVVECSSYQIDLAPSLTPDVGVLLNITPDHLDRHGTMENYASIKERLVARAKQSVIGVDDDWCKAIAARRNGATDKISIHAENNGLDLAGAPSLRGVHNLQNALVAQAVCRHLGLTEVEISAGLASFPGLAHRMQIVAERHGVLFVNDSKATNADAAEKSLSSFENIRWIAGGLAKSGGIEPLRLYFGRVRKAYLIGEAAAEFAVTLGSDVAFEISDTLPTAVEHALEDAETGDVVLLAPAAASFDQFANFEVRGEAFVKAIDTIVAQRDSRGERKHVSSK